jgi:Ca-activated chloride channel family protein
MQCLADETGGQFLLADNATELGSALNEVTQAAAVYPTLFFAQDGEDGGRIETPLIWDLTQGDDLLVDFERGASLTQDLPSGSYTVSVLRPEDEASVALDFVVADAGQTLTLILPSSLPDASVSGPATAVAGATITVDWDGPDAKNDYLTVAKPDDKGYVNYVYTREGTPAPLLMPPEPGGYELRYVMADGKVTLASQPITVTEAAASLDAPSEAPAGATIPISWVGPDYKNDYIGVSRPDEDGYVNYTYTREGAPLDLILPSEPGTYELRYFMSQDKTVLATQPITVTDVSATLDVPATAAAGAELPVTWT